MTEVEKTKRAYDMQSVRGVLKRVVSENWQPHMRSYVLAIFCLVLVAATTAYTAWIMEAVINQAFFSDGNSNLIWLICLSIFLTFVLRGLATYWQAVLLTKVGNAIVADYQRRIYGQLMRLSVGFYSEARSAHLAARISQNIDGVRNILNLTITSLARDVLTFLGLVGVMVVKDWMLTVIMLVAAPPLLLGLRYVSKRLRNVTRQAVELNSRVLGAMQETVQGITIVKAFTMEKQLNAKVQVLIDNAEERANRIARLAERTAPMTETFAGLAISSVLAYAAYRSIYTGAEPGAFFAFVTALLMAYDPARRLARLQVHFEAASTNARMLYELLDIVPDQRDVAGARALTVERATIEFRGVVFGYGNGKPVLNGVSFTAEGGKTTALVGPSGAGKSTIISLVPRFHDPAAGQILIDGQDIAQVTKASLRHHIAYVSQQPYLFEGTIRDNIRYGRPEATDAEVERAARMAYAHDFILAQPQGYDTPVGENGMTLSGGQRQRLSIARALVRDAPILLLDEATSALDTESEAFVQKALDTAMTGRTVIVIAHRLSTVVNADRIVVMQEGEVAEEGTHEALITRENGLYARLNNLQTVRADIE